MRLSEELPPNSKSGLPSNDTIDHPDTENACATMNSSTNVLKEAGLHAVQVYSHTSAMIQVAQRDFLVFFQTACCVARDELAMRCEEKT
jgi:hypothetical protein